MTTEADRKRYRKGYRNGYIDGYYRLQYEGYGSRFEAMYDYGYSVGYEDGYYRESRQIKIQKSALTRRKASAPDSQSRQIENLPELVQLLL